MAAKKIIFKNLAVNFLSRGVVMFIKLITTLLLAAYLNSTDFGIYVYSITAMLFFEALCGFGVFQLFYKRASQNDSKFINFNVLILCALSSIIIFLLVQIFLYLNPNNNLLIVSFSLLINPFIFFFEKLFVAKRHSLTVSISSCVFPIVSFFIKLILLTLNFPMIVFLYLYVLDGLILLIIYLFFALKFNLLKDSMFFIKKYFVQKLIIKSFPLLVSSLSIVVYLRIDIIMLEKFLNDFEVIGQYSLAANFTMGFAFALGSIGFILTPYFLKGNRNYSLINNNFAVLFLALFILSLINIIIILLFFDYLISFIFSDKYPNLFNYLTYLIFCLPFVAIGGLATQLAVIHNIEKINMINTVFAALINLILNFILIPYYGVYGAILSSIFSYSFASYLGYFFHKDGKIVFITISKIFNINTTKSLLHAISKK